MARKSPTKPKSSTPNSEAKAPTRGQRLAQTPTQPPRILAIEETDPNELAESLGLDQFQDPDDAGLSLEELGQAYAALMTQGTDPYEAAPVSESQNLGEDIVGPARMHDVQVFKPEQMTRLVRDVGAKLLAVSCRGIRRDGEEVAENKSVVVVIPVAGVVCLG